MVAVAEPLSPELVLVAGDLRATAIAALPDPAWMLYSTSFAGRVRAREAQPREDAPAAEVWRGALIVARALGYLAWHALLGACLGVGVGAAIALALLMLDFFV
jgi:hypothetical protein